MTAFGTIVFVLAPVVLAAVLLWRFPATRQLHVRSLAFYLIFMTALITGAVYLVA